jgi:hypothetical protein
VWGGAVGAGASLAYLAVALFHFEFAASDIAQRCAARAGRS